MRRKSHSQFHEPSLVPLADMLTNTVGIVVFILIFTVLTAGGAMVRIQLPRERPTTAERASFICFKGRLIFLDEDPLIDRFVKPIVKNKRLVVNGEPLTRSNVAFFFELVNSRKIEDQFVVMTGEARMDASGNAVDVSVEVTPKPGVGDAIADMRRSDNAFRRFLASHDPQKRFIKFNVFPDSLELYKAARDVARAAGYQTGWDARGSGQKIGFNLTGGGRKDTVQ